MKAEELQQLKAHAIESVIRWAQTGNGYFSMKDRANEYMEATGANKSCGNDEESIRLGRCAVALEISIGTIHALNRDQLQLLDRELREIADDFSVNRTRTFQR